MLIPRGVTPLEGLVTHAAGPAEPRLIQFKSTDGGASWTAVNTGLTNANQSCEPAGRAAGLFLLPSVGGNMLTPR